MIASVLKLRCGLLILPLLFFSPKSSFGANPAFASAMTALSSWDVTVVSSDVDTLWVDLRLLNANLSNQCASFVCVSALVYYQVTPCPLRIVGLPSVGCDGSSSALDTFAVSGFKRIGLTPGVAYTFYGHFQMTGGAVNPVTHVCEYSLCTYQEFPPDRDFGGPLPAAAVSWGHIKTMYRTP